MNLRIAARAIVALVAAIILSALTAQADKVPFLEGTGVQTEGSQIDLFHVFAMTGYNTWVCANFTNTAEKTATAVYLQFEYVSVDKANAGQIVGQDSQIARGRFSTGTKIEARPVAAQMPTAIRICHAVGATIGDDVLGFANPPRATRLQARVLRVDYEDGTKWEAPSMK